MLAGEEFVTAGEAVLWIPPLKFIVAVDAEAACAASVVAALDVLRLRFVLGGEVLGVARDGPYCCPWEVNI